MTVDSNKGCTVQRIRTFNENQLSSESEFEYAEIDGAWVMVGATTTSYNPGSGKVERRVSLQVDQDSLKVNQLIDQKMFTVDSLGIRKGSLISDQLTGQEYLYEDVPLHLKHAVQEAMGEMYDMPEDLGTVATYSNHAPSASSGTSPFPHENRPPTVPANVRLASDKIVGVASVWFMIITLASLCAAGIAVAVLFRHRRATEQHK